MSRNGRRPGRPRLVDPPVQIQVKLRLYLGQDDDLIAWFDGIPDGLRSAMVKSALRTGAGAVSLADLPDEDEMVAALDDLMEDW